MNRLMQKPGPPFYLLALLLGFGFLYAFLVPPFQSPDEPNHFLRAWQVSNGQFIAQKTPDHRLGGVLPKGLQAFTQSFQFLRTEPAQRISVYQVLASNNINVNASEQGFIDFANTAIYAPTAYLPQALGIGLGRGLGWGPLGCLYAARCANLLLWGLLWWWALYLFPFQQRVMTALALMPASLVMAASCNADGITNGLCILVFAGLLSRRPSLFYGCVAALLLVAIHKLITLPLVLLLWVNAPEKHVRNLFYSLIIVGAALGWALFANQWFIPYDLYHPDFRDTQTLNAGVDPAGQLQWILGHPFTFIRLVWGSYLQALPSTTAHWVGKFGWEKNYLPVGWIALLLGLFIVLASTEKNTATRSQRGLAALAALLYLILFAITMFALWHPVGAPELSNLQGRYFVPILPLLVYAFGNQYFKIKEKWVNVGLGSILCLGNLAMVVAIYLRYYQQ